MSEDYTLFKFVSNFRRAYSFRWANTASGVVLMRETYKMLTNKSTCWSWTFLPVWIILHKIFWKFSQHLNCDVTLPVNANISRMSAIPVRLWSVSSLHEDVIAVDSLNAFKETLDRSNSPFVDIVNGTIIHYFRRNRTSRVNDNTVIIVA